MHDLPATPGYGPREPPPDILILRQRHEPAPVVEHRPQIVNLFAQSDAAVGVHGADFVEIFADLAESAEALGAQEHHLHAYLLKPRIVLDDVEHVLLVDAWESGARRVPELVEFDAAGV